MENNLPPVSGPQGTETSKETTGKNPAAAVKKKKLNGRQIFMIVLIVLVILLPFSVYWFMDLQTEKINVRHQVAMDSLKARTSKIIQEKDRINLQTVARVFSWAVRAELMRNNMEQLNQIMVELVKTQGYRQVVLLSETGAVVLSTDKKYEGREYTANFYSQIAGSDQVQLNVMKTGDLLVSAPVYGFDKRLGSVVISYTPEKILFTNDTVSLEKSPKVE